MSSILNKGYFDKYHIFRDPIHGFIKVYDIERDIINSKAFQRLRRIKQLGMTNLVYHGAEHTRFGHSLGVMEVASRIFDTIVEKDINSEEKLIKNKAKWKKVDIERNKIILRLVALLHDIGHCPFSHGAEKLFKKGITHEEMSAKIIEGDGEISQILDFLKEEYNINKKTVANIIRKKEIIPLVKQIIDGPLDADKIDYLWRDSFYSGVYYGRFDVERLINTMTVVYNKTFQDIDLGLEEGGKYAAESLMLARYYMFLQIYFHRVRRAYDKHLSIFLKEFLKNHFNKEYYPVTIKKYLDYDDNLIMNYIFESKNDRSIIGKYANIILKRNHYVVLKESPDYTSDKIKTLYIDNYNKLKVKLSEIDMLIDNTNDAPNKFKKEPFYIKLRNPLNGNWNSKYLEIDFVSDVIKKLDEKILKYRIYIPQKPKSKFDKIQKICNRLQWEL